MVVGEGPEEVRRHVGAVGEIGPRVGTGPEDPLQAGPAVAARVEVAEDDPIAHRKRLAGRVAGQSFAQGVHRPGHLVAEDLRIRAAELGHVKLSPPLVQV